MSISNQKIFSFIRKGNIDSLKQYFSPQFFKKLGNLKERMALLQDVVPPKNTQIIDQYWVKGLKPGVITPVISPSMTYFINYLANFEEEFITILRHNKGNQTSQTICLYGRKGKNHPWKMDFFQTADWGHKNQGAMDYYQKSKQFMDKGYFLNAFLEARIAYKYAKAPQGLFQYRQEQDLMDHLNTLAKKMNESFTLPIKIDSLPGKPEIMAVAPQVTTDGFFPMIVYLTDVKFEPDFLKKECDLIHAQIEKIFPCITKFRTSIFYRAYNRKDKEKKRHYGIIKKTPLPKD